jgi:hypothetical protein
MTGKIGAFVAFDVDRRRPRAIFVIQLPAGDPADIALLERWRLVHRRDLLNGGVIVLFVEQDDAVICSDKIVWLDLARLESALIEIAKFDFENRGPRRFCDARRNHTCR